MKFQYNNNDTDGDVSWMESEVNETYNQTMMCELDENDEAEPNFNIGQKFKNIPNNKLL
jgi:hypothetical protein